MLVYIHCRSAVHIGSMIYIPTQTEEPPKLFGIGLSKTAND